MKNNFENILVKGMVCSICGLLMAHTFTGFLCQNSECPDYLLERHDHLPEKTYDSGINVSGRYVSSSGTASTSTSDYLYQQIKIGEKFKT